jgi:predicted nucleic acid-binding protein
MPDEVYFEAAQLRARFGLKTPDALHLATAQHHRCDALWTNDDRLAQVSHGLARNILGEAGDRRGSPTGRQKKRGGN